MQTYQKTWNLTEEPSQLWSLSFVGAKDSHSTLLPFKTLQITKKKRLETHCLKDTIFNKRFKYNQCILITTLMNWSKPWWFFGFRSASSHDQSIKTLMNWSMPWWLFNIDPWRKQHSFDDVQVHHDHDGWSRSWWMVKF